jgi:hypothetical protein
MQEIKIININFYNALVVSNPTTWANSQFHASKYGVNTSNSAESIILLLNHIFHVILLF